MNCPNNEDSKYFIIQGPPPNTLTITLPSPEFSDGEGLADELVIKRAVNGTRRTFIKRKSRRKLFWEFRINGVESMALRSFLRSYFASTIRVIDHKGKSWSGKLVNNPFEFVSERDGNGVSKSDINHIRLEFEGREDS